MEEVWNRTQSASTRFSALPAPCRRHRRDGITNERESVVLWDQRQDARSRVRLSGRTPGRPPPPTRLPPTEASSASKSHRPADPTYSSALKLGSLLDRTGPRGRRPTGETGCSAPGHLAAVEPDRRTGRRRARHRPQQRQPHPADGPPHARLGRRPARRDGDPACPASRDPLIQRGVRPGRRRAVRRPVAGILGDQPASLFGHTCFDHGDVKTRTAPERSCSPRWGRSR